MIEFQFLSPHPTVLTEQQLLDECQWVFTKRGGPGGQHRNKTQSAALLTHKPTSITAEANERRDQHQNRRVAIERLRFLLAWQVRDAQLDGDTESGTSPSDLWKRRSRGGRIHVSVSHWDFPQLIAEALNHLYRHDFSVAEAAVSLEVTSGQLTKLFRAHPPSLDWLNRIRGQRGHSRLK